MKTFPIFNGAKSDGKPWFTVRNWIKTNTFKDEAGRNTTVTEPVSEILIYEQIGKDWWSDTGIGAKDFIDEVKQIPKGQKIDLRINSQGGNVHDGLAIYNYLKQRAADVTVYVDGVAASIASIIALAGSKLVMPRNALLMIHDPWTVAQGSADDMRKAADALDAHKASLVSIYEDKTGKGAKEISAAMTEETWFTGDAAKEFGLCDEVTGEVVALACSNMDFSNFRRVPDSLKAQTPRQPAAPSGTPNPQNTMNKEQIIALLKKNGIEVPKDATEEQLMNLLSGAVNNKPAPAPAPAPANVIDVNAILAANTAELKAMRDERDAQKKANIKAALTVCGNEGRIPLNSVDGWAESCMKDESLLAKVQAMEPKLPGAEPVAMHVEITSESPEAFNAAFDKFNAPFKAFAATKQANENTVKTMKEAAIARASLIAKNSNRILQIMNTNTVSTELKRQVILQDGIRAFRRVLIPLNAFSTVFQGIPLLGTDKVEVPYNALETAASTDFVANDGYTMGNTDDSVREITIDKRKYQSFDFSSATLRRQPFFNQSVNLQMKAEKLALDVFQDILSVITAANYGAAIVISPASAFDRDDVSDLRGAANTANWPLMMRSMFLDTEYDTNLFKDSKIVDADKSGDQDAIRRGVIRNLLGFDYFGASNYIPANAEALKGFIAWKSAILAATSPILPTEEVLSQLTTYDVIMDEQTGIAFEYRRWGSADYDKSKSVVECNYGYAKGEAAALKRLTES